MYLINFEFYNKRSYEKEVIRNVEIIPDKDDKILFEGRWYKVDSREFNLNTGKITKIICKN